MVGVTESYIILSVVVVVVIFNVFFIVKLVKQIQHEGLPVNNVNSKQECRVVSQTSILDSFKPANHVESERASIKNSIDIITKLARNVGEESNKKHLQRKTQIKKGE